SRLEPWNPATPAYVSCRGHRPLRSFAVRPRRKNMNGDLTGLAAVIMIFGIPMAAMYTYYRVRKLRSEERLAAIARGVSVPMEPDAMIAAAFGLIPLTLGIGFFIDAALVRRDLRV